MFPRALAHAAVLAVAGLTPVIGFGGIIFDPDGSGALPALNVSTFDFMPGNALAQGALATPTSITQYYQARLGALLDDNGEVIPLSKLNAPDGFQITIVTGYAAQGTWSNGVFTASQTQGTSFMRIYQHAASTPLSNDALTASDLTGLGFADGTLIYSGTITDASSVFMRSGTGTDRLDRFGADDYTGVRSITGIGGFDFASTPDYLNTDFFQSGFQSMTVDLNTSTALVFKQTNPSARFTDATGGSVIPNLGATNGVTGSDLQTQADANASFTVPEPASLALVGLGLAALCRGRRK